MRRIHPGLKKKIEKVPSRFKRFCIYLSWRNSTWPVIKQTSHKIWVVCNKLTTVWAQTNKQKTTNKQKLLVSWQLSRTYDVLQWLKEGCRKRVLGVWSRRQPVNEGGTLRASLSGTLRWGEWEIIYLSLHCHHQNDSCIIMGSDDRHFNVSVRSDGQSHKTVSTNHNLFEEKGERKRYRTEVLLLASLTPYR